MHKFLPAILVKMALLTACSSPNGIGDVSAPITPLVSDKLSDNDARVSDVTSEPSDALTEY